MMNEKDFEYAFRKLSDCRMYEESIWNKLCATGVYMTRFAVEGNKVYLSIVSTMSDDVIDVAYMNGALKMYGLECSKQFSDTEIWYEVAETDIKFNNQNVCLIRCVTDDGFVLDTNSSELLLDDVVSLLADNPELALFVRDGKAVIACR